MRVAIYGLRNALANEFHVSRFTPAGDSAHFVRGMVRILRGGRVAGLRFRFAGTRMVFPAERGCQYYVAFSCWGGLY